MGHIRGAAAVGHGLEEGDLVPIAESGDTPAGAIATADNGALPYPASTQMGLLTTAIQNNISDFLTGKESAKQTLQDIEAACLVAAMEAGVVK